ncbi:aspartate aminotransferase family protein [bacterium]|nr:aspartate aminotransferase family protein [bacterium]
MKIPTEPLTREQIMRQLATYRTPDLDIRGGRVFAYTYTPPTDVEETTKQAYLEYLSENALDPTSFPSLVAIEREVVRMVASLLRGDDRVVGSFTSGGTESILLAVKSARDKARAEHPEITRPEIVLPKSAHGAFHKACDYFGLQPILVPLDRATFQVDLDAFRQAITPNTILLVGSAPQYAQGVVDPIRALGQIALDRGLWLHVDACVGGIHLSFQRDLPGWPHHDFDFSVPGVSSLSVDMHKYGYAPKGASIVLYRDKSYRRFQIFSTIASATYALVNANIQSSRSGGPIAAAWGVLHAMGQSGYRQIVDSSMQATQKIVDHINQSKHLRVLGKPDVCMFSIASETINVFELADEMRRRRWYLQPQFSTEWTPMNLHISVSNANVPVVDEFLFDLDQSVEALSTRSPLRIEDIRHQVITMLEGATPAEAMARLSASAGFVDGQLPEDMAFVNSVLEAMPREMGAYMLAEYLNDLYV